MKELQTREEKLATAIENTPGTFKELMVKFLEVHLQEFLTCPGSTKYHHAYPGGLCDHTLEVWDGVQALGTTFPELDMESALTAALLHDIGKIKAYQPNTLTRTGKIPAQKYLRTGNIQKIGDIGETLIMITQIMDHILLTDLEFAETANPHTWENIQHIIASHHGEVRRGWGSLVNPNTPEAQAVHFIDMTSSRIRTHIPTNINWEKIIINPNAPTNKKEN